MTVTGLTPGTTYHIRAYATNSIGTAYGEEITFSTLNVVINENDGQPCTNNTTVTDIDGNIYNTVQIGEQCWMKENVRSTHYANGDEIIFGTSSSYTDAYRYYPNGDTNNVSTYGYLYNWAAATHDEGCSSLGITTGVQGICPNGWHIPSRFEWQSLYDYLLAQNRHVCSSIYNNQPTLYIGQALASTSGWLYVERTCSPGNNTSDNNSSGFSAMPAGVYNPSNNQFSTDIGKGTYFWSCSNGGSSGSSNLPYSLSIYSATNTVSVTTQNKNRFCSVRCVKD